MEKDFQDIDATWHSHIRSSTGITRAPEGPDNLHGAARVGDDFYHYPRKRQPVLPARTMVVHRQPDGDAGSGSTPVASVAKSSVYGFFRFQDTTVTAGAPLAALVSGQITDTDWDSASPTELVISNLTSDIPLSAGLCIWLKVPVDGTTVTPSSTIDPTIEHGSAFPAPLTVFDTSTPPKQTMFHVPLAKVITGTAPEEPGFDFKIGTGGGAVDYHLLQLQTQNLRVYDYCSVGRPAISAEGWAGASN